MTQAKPRALKLLAGDHPERVNQREPQPPLGAVPPSWLPRRGVAWTTWQKHVRILSAVRVMTEADSDALALGCRALAEALDATRVDNWRRADSCWRRYWQMLQHFGLTPASRTKIMTAPTGEKDPLAEWQASRKEG